jgi:hypothetical protein
VAVLVWINLIKTDDALGNSTYLVIAHKF